MSEIGMFTSSVVSNLVVGKTYYFVVTAYNALGLESPPSNEVSFTPTPNAHTLSGLERNSAAKNFREQL